MDLSEIQLNFELEESEMRIFSEDESLVSSPRIHKEVSVLGSLTLHSILNSGHIQRQFPDSSHQIKIFHNH